VEPDALPRHLRLDGAVNCRDLGGYRTEGGGQTRWRRILRADGLSRLSAADLEQFAALGLRTVIDLRTADEVALGRFPVEALEVDFHHLALLASIHDPEDFVAVPGLLAQSYLDMVDQSPQQLVRVLEVLSDEAATPAIIHCTAGKDRTGVACALLLSILGCDRRTIVEDYTLSAAAMGALRARLLERFPEASERILAAEQMFAAEASAIEGLLEYLERNFGSPLNFALASGLDRVTVDALRAHLVTPAG